MKHRLNLAQKFLISKQLPVEQPQQPLKKAVLSLKVTPQITPDHKVVLTLKVHQDTPSDKEYLGVPAIDTRNIETQVLVENGGTIVLGGIYQNDKTNQVYRVPFFGSLPLIGNLFRNTSEKYNKRELLVFITPKIIQQQA